MSRTWDSGGHGFSAVLKHLESPHQQGGTIKKACAAVEECIVNNKDNLRGFFQHCFPVLLTRLFGFDDFEASWFTIVAKPSREEDAQALVNLLSPRGKLFAAMHSADAEKLIQFMFPLERLPAHTQELLKAPGGRAELEKWPQYKGRLRIDALGQPQVILNMFEYFMFWTAFYVLRGSRAADSSRSSNGQGRPRPGQQLVQGIRSYGTNIVSSLRDHWDGSQGVAHPYFRLLRTYLTAYLPRPGAAEGGSAGAAGVMLGRLGATGAFNIGSPGEPSPGDTILSILMEFWLTDVGEPVPPDPAAQTPGSSGVTSPRDLLTITTGAPGAVAPALTQAAAAAASAAVAGQAALRSFSYQPPAEELVQAVTVLVRYVLVIDPSSPDRPPMPAQGKVPWLPLSPVQTHPLPAGRLAVAPHSPLLPNAPCVPAEQAVARKLYRLLRRAFAQWQPSSSASLTPLLKLWITVLAPWRTPSGADDGRGGGNGGGGAYLPHAAAATMTTINRWGSGIVQHLPRTSSNPDGAGGERAQPVKGTYGPEWQPHVLTHLPFYLILLPHFVELCYSRMAYRADHAVRDLYRVMRELETCPELVTDLRAWEQAYNRYLSSSPRRPEGELAELLPWLADQAADFEVAAAAGAPTTPPILPDATYSLFATDHNSAAFCARALLRAADSQGVSGSLRSYARNAVGAVLPVEQLPDEEAGGAVEETYEGSELQFPKAGRWQELKYHGDTMTRPIASNEVPLLVRSLVAVSQALNRALGLDCYSPPPDEQPETLVQEWLQLLRRRRFRFNLRPLAEIQTLVWLSLLGFILYWVVGALLAPRAGSDGGFDEGLGAQQAAAPAWEHHQHHWQHQQHEWQPAGQGM